jgi:putative polyketide hydroxylase
LDVSIERTGAFTFAAQLADRFRAGNVFLAGDAAHRVTPRGGTGMNTAIRGGHDLGWKLGWVLRGWAGPELLDTYEAERRPIAAHNVARSADPDGSTRETADELHVDLGGRIARVWIRSGAGRVSTLDLLGPGLTLFTGPDSAPWGAQANGGPPVSVRPLDAVSARAIGIRGRGVLLVRPDGTPARLWTHEAAAAS